jgi:hypothetical protein
VAGRSRQGALAKCPDVPSWPSIYVVSSYRRVVVPPKAGPPEAAVITEDGVTANSAPNKVRIASASLERHPQREPDGPSIARLAHIEAGVARGRGQQLEVVLVQQIAGPQEEGPAVGGRYISFPDAPPPLEDTGGPSSKDISGTVLPGISKWAFSIGGEFARSQSLFGQAGQFFGAVDTSYRSDFSSSASYSRYLVVDGYSLVNARIGVRTISVRKSK